MDGLIEEVLSRKLSGLASFRGAELKSQDTSCPQGFVALVHQNITLAFWNEPRRTRQLSFINYFLSRVLLST